MSKATITVWEPGTEIQLPENLVGPNCISSTSVRWKHTVRNSLVEGIY